MNFTTYSGCTGVSSSSYNPSTFAFSWEEVPNVNRLSRKCPWCWKSVHLASMAEHMDYHVEIAETAEPHRPSRQTPPNIIVNSYGGF